MKNLKLYSSLLLIIATPVLSKGVGVTVGYSLGNGAQVSRTAHAPKQQLKHLTTDQLAAGVFALHHVPTTNALLDEQAHKDLQLDLFIERNNRALTTFGPLGLQELLQPSTDMALIAERQNAIKTIAQNNLLRGQLAQELAHVERGAKSLLEYWQPQIATLHAAVQHYYFDMNVTKWMNKSPNTLELSNILELFNASRTIMYSLVADGAWRWALNACTGGPRNPLNILKYGWENIQAQHTWSTKVSPADIMEPVISLANSGVPRDEMYKRFLGMTMPQMLELHSRQSLRDTYSNWSKAGVPRPLAFTYAFGGLVLSDYHRIISMRDAVRYFYAHLQNTKALQHSMTEVAQLFNAAHKIMMLLNKQVTTLTEPQRVLKKFFAAAAQDTELKELLALFKTSTLAAKTQGVNYRRGVVLRAHMLVQKNKNKLIPVLQAIAQIDGLYSLSVLMNEHATSVAPLSYVEFSQREKPVLQLQKLWVPLLPATQAVTNDVQLGEDSPTAMILTGPNGAGKSTIMKAIAYAIVLGQSVGIVPAQAGAVMTPIDKIVTYKSPEEKIAQNQSTFMAQKERAQQLEATVMQAPASQKIALFVDEPFNGTVEAEAAERTLNLARTTCMRSNVVGVFATHLEKPTELAEQNPAVFANYQLGLARQEDGVFTRTFKLLPGAATWWFQDGEMRREFVDQL